MTESVDIMSHLLTVSPALGVLVWMVFYFRGELKRKDEQIQAQNEENKALVKEMIANGKDLNNSLKELSQSIRDLVKKGV